MKLLLRTLFVGLAALIAYLCFWPVEIDPVAWNPPQAPSLEEGPFQKNDKLAAMKRHVVSEFGEGPEDL
ncbi:MAG: SMP-30/gluconolactonase/LRE family protein, partial [Bacteroidota bacterium]